MIDGTIKIDYFTQQILDGFPIVQYCIWLCHSSRSNLKAFLKANGLPVTHDFDANLRTARLAIRGAALLAGVSSEKMNGWIWEVEQGLITREKWQERENANQLAARMDLGMKLARGF